MYVSNPRQRPPPGLDPLDPAAAAAGAGAAAPAIAAGRAARRAGAQQEQGEPRGTVLSRFFFFFFSQISLFSLTETIVVGYCVPRSRSGRRRRGFSGQRLPLLRGRAGGRRADGRATRVTEAQ
jgi:hypothetical protein